MELQDIVTAPQDRSLVSTTVWALFNAEHGRFKVKVWIFNFDAESLVRAWITAKFGPDPMAV